MMAESGLIPAEEIKDWLILVAIKGQNSEQTLELENGLIVPPWAVAEHINFDGGAVFYPGTYSSGKNQGNGKYGTYPPHVTNIILLKWLIFIFLKIVMEVFWGKSSKVFQCLSD